MSPSTVGTKHCAMTSDIKTMCQVGADFYDGNMMKKKYVASALSAAPLVMFLSGCSMSDFSVDKFDESTEKSAQTSQAGVASELLPTWVPAGGTNVELVQRNTGSERIFVMDYDGQLPNDKCITVATAGKPSAAELKKAYASDPRTKNFDSEEISTTRTLEADWWPDDAEAKTTNLCGRFWVHQSGGKLYAFAPDNVETVKAVQKERSAA